MYVAGFSINVLTMLAVVLSVGLVVDDAIVMTENIYIRIERGMKPFDAGIEGYQRNIFRCYFYYHNIGCCVLAYRIYGRNQWQTFPGVQLRYSWFGINLFFCSIDIYPNACDQNACPSRKTKLVLPKD